jgi:hypothetical protein
MIFTGFAIAALIAWKLIVANAIMITNAPARANIHQLILIRYAKSCSHLVNEIIYHGNGEHKSN